jgi:hypothetical protein
MYADVTGQIELTLRDPSVEEFNTSKLLRNAAHQAEKRSYKDFLIVDCDSHHYETELLPEILDFMEDPVVRHLGLSRGQIGRSGLVRRTWLAGSHVTQDEPARRRHLGLIARLRSCDAGWTR